MVRQWYKCYNLANVLKTETRAEKCKRRIDFDAYVISVGRTAEEIDGYLKELRDDQILRGVIAKAAIKCTMWVKQHAA